MCSALLIFIKRSLEHRPFYLNMEHFKRKNIPEVLYSFFSELPSITYRAIPDCVGMSEEDISRHYSNLTFLPGFNSGEEFIEIRMDGITITLRMFMGLCLSGCVFNDHEE